MREPDIDCGLPLEPFFRNHQRAANTLMAAVLLSPLWLSMGLQVCKHWSSL